MSAILDRKLEDTQYLPHGKDVMKYCLARMLERAAYYGLKAILVLYFIDETINLPKAEALSIYGYLAASLVFTQIIGAVLGDLLLGNKKTIILGVVLQALGAFVLCMPNLIGIYIGIGLIATGSGFYMPNLTANFGKHYLDKKRLMDVGFTAYYFAINIGATIGVVILGFFGEKYGWSIGFIGAGILLLISILPITSIKEKEIVLRAESVEHKNWKIVTVILAMLLISIFWMAFELINVSTYQFQSQFGQMHTFIPASFWPSISTVFLIPGCLLAMILWYVVYTNQFIKLILGFTFAAFSILLMVYIPEQVSVDYIKVFLCALVSLSISEILIGPIFYSILSQYSNPKYLAIIISLSYLPMKFGLWIFTLFQVEIYDNARLRLAIAFVMMLIAGISVVVYLFLSRSRLAANRN